MAFLSAIRGLLNSEDLQERLANRGLINNFAGGALMNQGPAGFGSAFGGLSPVSTPVSIGQGASPGSIPLGQLSGIGEAVRSPEELAQLGASIPVATRSVQPSFGSSLPSMGAGLADDEQAQRIASIASSLFRGGLFG